MPINFSNEGYPLNNDEMDGDYKVKEESKDEDTKSTIDSRKNLMELKMLMEEKIRRKSHEPVSQCDNLISAP